MRELQRRGGGKVERRRRVEKGVYVLGVASCGERRGREACALLLLWRTFPTLRSSLGLCCLSRGAGARTYTVITSAMIQGDLFGELMDIDTI